MILLFIKMFNLLQLARNNLYNSHEIFFTINHLFFI